MGRGNFFLGLVSSVLSLGVAEIGLYGVETQLGMKEFRLFREVIYENFYFYHSGSPAPKDPPPTYDPLLGWRNDPRGGRGTLPPLELVKDKIRIAFLGDSFVYGFNLNDSETVVHYLNEYLGPKYEVMNFGVSGYGIDQMAILATRRIQRYDPDMVIFGFISDDLRRSCTPFSNNRRKPYFAFGGGRLRLEGVPVATPYEAFLEHQSLKGKIVDTILAWAQRSRIVCLVGSFFLQRARRECLEELNPFILKTVRDRLGRKTPLIFVHLDGKLPEKFIERVREFSLNFLSFPSIEQKLAEEAEIFPQRQGDGHPKASLNQLYAYGLSQEIKKIQ